MPTHVFLSPFTLAILYGGWRPPGPLEGLFLPQTHLTLLRTGCPLSSTIYSHIGWAHLGAVSGNVWLVKDTDS